MLLSEINDVHDDDDDDAILTDDDDYDIPLEGINLNLDERAIKDNIILCFLNDECKPVNDASKRIDTAVLWKRFTNYLQVNGISHHSVCSCNKNDHDLFTHNMMSRMIKKLSSYDTIKTNTTMVWTKMIFNSPEVKPSSNIFIKKLMPK